MNELELVVFDLAGTTVEDRGQVPDAFISALADHGIQVSRERVNAVRGSSKRQAILTFIPSGPGQRSLAEEAYKTFRVHLARQYTNEGVQAVPGAEEVFRRLRERGVRVALNTGFDHDTTGVLLTALGWTHGVVDAAICGDDVTQGRPAPDLIFKAMAVVGVKSALRVAAVGDTVLDLQAGARAGVRWNIGVLTGAHDRPALENAPHTHILPTVADLPGLWPDF